MTINQALLRFNTAAASNGPPYMITLSIAHPLIYCIWSVILFIAGRLGGTKT